LKLFNMEKLDADKKPAEIPSATVVLEGGKNATVMACTPDMSYVAIGFLTGRVVLIHYTNQFHHAQTRPICYHHHLEEIPEKPGEMRDKPDSINGLEFKRDESLYVVTDRGFFEYSIQLTDQNQFRLFGNTLTTPAMPDEVVLDMLGAEPHCTTVTDEGEVIVGTEPAVFFWKDEDKRQCLAFEGKKTFVQWFRGNLIVVTERPAPTPVLPQSSSSSISSDPNDQQHQKMYELTIYDNQNRLIAFQDNRLSGVQLVAFEWGSVFVFTSEQRKVESKKNDERDGRRGLGFDDDRNDSDKPPEYVLKTFMYELVEKDTQSKLESLFKKNLYPVAITLAQNSHLDSAAVASIITRFAEHLYNKGDYDGSIQQFIRTIGQLEPSYVITKFLDAQRINNLTMYLQKLHEKGLANTDHTTLLLNCYTKLQDAEKLEQFLSKEQGGNFDVETAIKVCRSGGYADHALRLSQQYHEHDWYLKIQLEDKHNYDVALQYISGLRHDDMELYLKKYGKILVSHIPEETTQQLVTMCTTDPVQPTPSETPSASSVTSSAIEETPTSLPPVEQLPASAVGDDDLPPVVQLDLGTFDPVAPTKSQFASAAMEKASAAMGAATAAMDKAANFFTSMLPIGKNNSGEQKEGNDEQQPTESYGAATAAAATAALAQPESKDYDPLSFYEQPVRFERSKPEDFIHIYVGLPRWLRIFLESVIAKTENVSGINYDTLLELYLRGQEDSSHPETKEEKEERLEKARQLLLGSRTIHYDQHHALVLCQRYGFDSGVLILLEKLGMCYEIIQMHMDRHEYSRVLQDCHKFGSQDPNLWIQALTYFATLDDDDSHQSYEESIQDILRNIDKLNLMSPLLVLQILSQKASMPLDIVKDYITGALQGESKLLSDNQSEIDNCRRETAKLRDEIQELTTQPKVFQISKCTLCGRPLNPPAVHFLCMHSFHQHCLSENDRECPVCAPANHLILETKHALEEKANKHKQFMKELEGAKDGCAKDGFSVIADYCGRSIFGCLNSDPADAAAAAAAAQNGLSSSTLPVAVPLDI